MINENMCFDIIDYGINHGAKFVEIFAEHAWNSRIALVNRDIKNMDSSEISGTGIRIMMKDKISYVYINSYKKDKLIELMKNIIMENQLGYKRVLPQKSNNAVSEFSRHDNLKKQIKLGLLWNIYGEVSSRSSLIKTLGVEIDDKVQEILVCNSEGIYKKDYRNYSRCTAKVVVSNQGKIQTGIQTICHRKGFEYWKDICFNEWGKQFVDKTINMLYAEECPAGKFPVIINSGFGGVLFHEACGHSLESSNIINNATGYMEKLGKKIAAESVTLVDDGSIAGAWGSNSIDDEGTETRRNILIEHGELKGIMVDYNGAELLKLKKTGNGRRQNYTYMPVARMTNTFIEAASGNEKDLFKGVDKGLYVANVGGGSVNTVTGEYNFSVTEGYWIENGKIAYPVKGASLIGKGNETLLNIEKISNDLRIEHGMCIAKSGKIPVGIGQPQIKIAEMIIGGKHV